MDFQQIKNKFDASGIIEQLIYINVLVYICTFILAIFRNNLIYDLFSLYSNISDFINKPWGIISYGFVHSGFIHLLSNVLGLYYFGNLFLTFFSKKDVVNLYLLGTVFGGIFYLLVYAIFPQLGYSKLVGSSAAVSALLIAMATYLPNYEMRFALIGNIKLRYIAIFWVCYNLLFITANNNLGGNLAHLGGALFGFIYIIKKTNKTIDFSKFNIFLFNKTKKIRKETPFKNVYKNKPSNTKRTQTKNYQQKIDSILDKIGKSGYESLSKEEKEFLFKQSKDC